MISDAVLVYSKMLTIFLSDLGVFASTQGFVIKF